MDYSELSYNSKTCAANNATKNQVGGDTSKKIEIRAEKLGDDESSARLYDTIEKLCQTEIYREINQLKEKEKSRIEKLSAKQKLYVAAKEVIKNIYLKYLKFKLY